MALSAEDEAAYTFVIDEILSASDLNTVSAKAVRKGLQVRVGHDITLQKKAITELIHDRFDKLNSEQNATNGASVSPAPEAETATVNGTTTAHSRGSPKKRSPSPVEDADGYSSASSATSSPPPKKKVKKPAKAEDTDAAYAARLQAEECRTARATRGGGSSVKKRGPVKKSSTEKVKRKKKSATKIAAADDSDLENGDGTPDKKVNRSGGFHKPMALSEPLSQLLGGETTLSRPQCVKKIWDYVKERGLQDPNDKRQIRCDDAMRAVFKQDRVHMFTMNKILASNLYAQDE